MPTCASPSSPSHLLFLNAPPPPFLPFRKPNANPEPLARMHARTFTLRVFLGVAASIAVIADVALTFRFNLAPRHAHGDNACNCATKGLFFVAEPVYICCT